MTDEKAPTAEWPVFTGRDLRREFKRRGERGGLNAWDYLARYINNCLSDLSTFRPAPASEPDLERMRDMLAKATMRFVNGVSTESPVYAITAEDLAAEGFTIGTINTALKDAARIADNLGQFKTAQENRAMKSEETPMTKTFWTGFEVFQEVYPGKNHLWAKQPENVKEQWELAAILRMANGQARPDGAETFCDGYIAGLEDMREQIKAFIDRHWRFDEPHGPHTANDHLKVLAQEFGIAVPKDGDGR